VANVDEMDGFAVKRPRAGGGGEIGVVNTRKMMMIGWSSWSKYDSIRAARNPRLFFTVSNDLGGAMKNKTGPPHSANDGIQGGDDSTAVNNLIIITRVHGRLQY
jgi:hypothetical protein